jgi:hypothetical protein
VNFALTVTRVFFVQLASNSMLERRVRSLEDNCLHHKKKFNQTRETLRNVERVVLKLQRGNAELTEKIKG